MNGFQIVKLMDTCSRSVDANIVLRAVARVSHFGQGVHTCAVRGAQLSARGHLLQRNIFDKNKYENTPITKKYI